MEKQTQGERKLPGWYTKPIPWWYDFVLPPLFLLVFGGLAALLLYGAYYLLSALL